MVIGFETALEGLVQVNEEVITTVTIALFVNVEVWNTESLFPTLFPLTFHWYDAIPPFTGVAVKITLAPVQIVVADATILTEGTTAGLTVIVTTFELAVCGNAQ